jgi:hypothetical protein
VSSPALLRFESVVLTVARPSPVALATSPAVIALPWARAARTAAFVAPGAVRAGALLAPFAGVVAREACGFGEAPSVVDCDVAVVRDRAGLRLAEAGAGRVRRRAGDVDELPSLSGLVASSRELNAASAWRSFSASESNASSRV